MLSRMTIGMGAWVLAWAASAAEATWSIVIVDVRTKEVAVGSATCLTDFDLEFWLPVVRVNTGAAAAQSFVDSTGRNRELIWRELRNGTDPAVILQLLEQQDGGHQGRQYGIVDTLGRAVTFTGSACGPYANGLTGRDRNLVYAIQGNVITGQPVLDRAEAALRNTPGAIPEKLMAAMEAAREMGGDGRCSCDPGDPDRCGSPPPDFEKSAHIGFMIVSRRGDVNGTCSRQTGCANGTYYMNFNVAFARAQDPDPVFQLRDMFDAWRQGLIGVPDAVESRVAISPRALVNDGVSQAAMTIDVLDWQGNAATGITGLTVEHTVDSAGATTIGPVSDLGNARYRVELTATTTAGLDLYRIAVTHASGEVILLPLPELRVVQRGDMNVDGLISAPDIAAFILALFTPDAYRQQFPDVPYEKIGDMNSDGSFNAGDIEGFVDALFGP